jgi:tyrosine-specific transport protein
MNKQIGAILLVAGTCIGSGMLALPLVLAKLGIVTSILLMLGIWGVMYFTSLINIELNLKAGTGLPLGDLGKLFSGPVAGWMGTISLKLLMYALMAVFLYAISSVTEKLTGWRFEYICGSYALGSIVLLSLPISFVDQCNRLLFIILVSVFGFLIVALIFGINWTHLPMHCSTWDIPKWSAIIPVVFTSFGFQVIFHTLTHYLDKDPVKLKRAFFWGSLIPASVYIIWTVGVISLIYNKSPDFFHKMVNTNVEVGDLVTQLSHVSNWPLIQTCVWWISILAILTSILGVGLGLVDSLKYKMGQMKWMAAPLAVIPAYIVAVWVPNAFIVVLGFAGMILAVIAILLPVYLFYKAKIKNLHYKELNSRVLIGVSAFVGMSVIMFELFNMINK